MASLLVARTFSVSIACPPATVYAFVRDLANLPRFLAFVREVRQVSGRWIVETSEGPVEWRFVADNDLGVLDHVVTLPGGGQILNPMRVVANGAGSEVTFTLFGGPDTTAQQFAADATLVERDLATLKEILEGPGVR